MKKNLIFAVVVTLVALAAGRAQAVAISAVGLDTTTAGSWRTTSVSKPLDIDNNNVYGSAGYIAYATGAHGLGGIGASPNTNITLLSALPAWASVSLTGLDSSYSGAYGMFDNPAAPGTTDSGFAWDQALAANTNTSLLDITVGTVGTFRLGVIQNGGGGAINSFTLESGAASATVSVNKTGNNDSTYRYTFFDVTAAPGTVLTLEVNGIPAGGSPVGISGLTFDLKPVPEPSSLLLAGLALASVLGMRVLRRRAV